MAALVAAKSASSEEAEGVKKLIGGEFNLDVEDVLLMKGKANPRGIPTIWFVVSVLLLRYDGM